MNICKIRNKAEDITMKIMGGKGYPEQAVSLGEALFWVVFLIFFIILVLWWFVPLRYILRSLDKRYRCDEEERM